MPTYYAGFIPGEDGQVGVIFPDVPGCVTCGDDMEHAQAMAVEALSGHLGCMARDKDVIPPPSSYEDAKTALYEIHESFDLGPLPEGTRLLPVSF